MMFRRSLAGVLCACAMWPLSACGEGGMWYRDRLVHSSTDSLKFRKPVSDVRLSPNGRYLAIGTGLIVVWELPSKKRIAHIGLTDAHAACVAVTPDAKYVVGAIYSDDKRRDPRVFVWDITGQQPKEVTNKQLDDRVFESMSLSHDGKRVAISQITGNVHVLSLPTLELIERIRAHPFPSRRDWTASVVEVAYLGESYKLITCGTDGALHVWDRDHNKIKSRTDLGMGLFALAVSDDAKKLAVQRRVGKGYEVLLLDAETLATIRVVGAVDLNLGAMAFAPDGTELAVGGSYPGYVDIFDTEKGAQIQTLGGVASGLRTGGDTFVETLEYINDGETLVTGSRDGHLALYDRQD